MTYFQLVQDRINLENISGYGEKGPKGIKIYFNSGETKSYGFGSTEDRDQVLEQIDNQVGLKPASQYKAL